LAQMNSQNRGLYQLGKEGEGKTFEVLEVKGSSSNLAIADDRQKNWGEIKVDLMGYWLEKLLSRKERESFKKVRGKKIPRPGDRR